MGFKAIFFFRERVSNYNSQMYLSLCDLCKAFFFFFGRNNMQRIKWLELKAYGFGLNL